MPLYEYVCEGCDHRYEAMQALSAKPEETLCPKCNTTQSRRIMSSFASKIVGTHKPGFAEGNSGDAGRDHALRPRPGDYRTR